MNEQRKEELQAIRARIANNFKNYRLSRRYSQERMSRNLGVKKPAYGAYEEARSFPNPFVLIAFSRLSGKSIDALLTMDVIWVEID